MGFFTDTSVCIGCKACEVACKEWNEVPEDGLRFSGESFDNTGSLGANSWRHVAFIEQPTRVDGVQAPDSDFRWLMSSDVCKHCTHAACLDVCPTGALFRTEFGTVVVQQDVCNGCGYCVPACPFGVIGRRETDDLPQAGHEDVLGLGTTHKCTLCYDRLKDGMEPACAQACPTESIQFGPLEELRERAQTARRATARAGRRRGGALWREPGRRRRRLRRILPAARQAGGLRAAARPDRADPPAPRDLGRGAPRRRRPRRQRPGGGRRRRADEPRTGRTAPTGPATGPTTASRSSRSRSGSRPSPPTSSSAAPPARPRASASPRG